MLRREDHPDDFAGLQGLREAIAAGIDNAGSDQWGRISAIRSVPVIDGLLAATALTHDLTLVACDDREVAGLGAGVMNPFGGDGDGIDLSLGLLRITSRGL